MQIKVFFFWNFRNIQTATLIRKRIISALIDKAGNSTAGNNPSHAAWATPALSTFRAGLWRLWPRET